MLQAGSTVSVQGGTPLLKIQNLDWYKNDVRNREFMADLHSGIFVFWVSNRDADHSRSVIGDWVLNIGILGKISS
jgi:hypothetical protein